MHNHIGSIDIRIGEIYRYYQGMNIGTEQSKDNPFMRPCIILSNRYGKNKALIAPLTTNIKPGKYKYILTRYTYVALKPCAVSINEIHIIDRKRLLDRHGIQRISLQHLNEINQLYKSFL